jgi:hypothetical protein
VGLTKDQDEFSADAIHSKAVKITKESPWLKKGNKKNKGCDNTKHGPIVVNEGKYLGEAVVFLKRLIRPLRKPSCSQFHVINCCN